MTATRDDAKQEGLTQKQAMTETIGTAEEQHLPSQSNQKEA